MKFRHLAVLVVSVTLWGACALRGIKKPTTFFQNAHVWQYEMMPLRVGIDDRLSGHFDNIGLAVEAFNDEVGCEIFSVVGSGVMPDVYISGDLPESAFAAADAQYIGNNKSLVRMGGLVSDVDAYVAAYHELGHVVGLDHDGYVPRPSSDYSPKAMKNMSPGFVSIMANNVLDHTYRADVGLVLPFLAPSDSAALNQRYCKG